jgi:uncharacterized cupredoxin-like copper-binding protein
MHLSKRVAFVAALVIALTCLAVPALAAPSHATGTTVKVSALDTLKFVLSTKTVHAGSVTFVVTNKGQLAHDFKIAGKKTALLKHGQTAKLTVTLKAGKYPYSCTVPGHAAAGMKGVITAK